MVLNKRPGIKIVLTCVVLLAVCMFSAVAQAETKYSGDYNGTFLGEFDYGWFALNIQPDGYISGNGRSTARDIYLEYRGTCQPDGTLQFTSTDGTLRFAGHIDWMSRIFGRWQREDVSGSGSFTAVSARWAE
ncbi:MAG: hypothetical protein WC922_00675 [Synergistaceae bacterium]|jgi:hypothetical protein|nr:hypothetical protein [Synergistaceae bacterium]MDD3672520.1 hypothetical protein [Synergistaceae bacterium]MDD4704701.1 hypothetical protein [Synergistaceae bacterium]MDD5421250.1 hypothetical protein [Synergistaceae bacterium]MDY0283515.1 hypothetical protein [Synergistaceae bacterium]